MVQLLVCDWLLETRTIVWEEGLEIDGSGAVPVTNAVLTGFQQNLSSLRCLAQHIPVRGWYWIYNILIIWSFNYKGLHSFLHDIMKPYLENIFKKRLVFIYFVNCYIRTVYKLSLQLVDRFFMKMTDTLFEHHLWEKLPKFHRLPGR